MRNLISSCSRLGLLHGLRNVRVEHIDRFVVDCPRVERCREALRARCASGGLHLFYRLADADVFGNENSARRPFTEAELSTNHAQQWQVLAGGGFVLLAPSGGCTQDRRPYTRFLGGPDKVTTSQLGSGDSWSSWTASSPQHSTNRQHRPENTTSPPQ